MTALDTITLQYGPMIETPCPVCCKINLAARRFTLTDPVWTRTVDACSGCGYVFSDTWKATIGERPTYDEDFACFD